MAYPLSPMEAKYVGGATHVVQIVEVEVRVTVEMVVVTSSNTWVPEVTVLVTGHVVKVVYTLCSRQSDGIEYQMVDIHICCQDLFCTA